MIQNGDGWYYLAVKTKNIRITFYFLNFPHPFGTKLNLNEIKRYVEMKVFAIL